MRKFLVAVAACLALGSAARAVDAPADWQSKFEEKMAKVVSVNFQDETLGKALAFFRRSGEINIILDSKAQDLAEKRLTLVLTRVKLESALAWTARLMGLDYVVRDEAAFLSKPDDMPVDWRGEMQERYRKMVAGGQEPWVADIEARLARTIKVSFHGEQMPQVIQYLATESGINIVLDYHLAEMDAPVRLEGEMTVKSALSWVVKLANVRYVVRDEVIYVATQDALAALRLETGESPLDMVFRRPVTFHFDKTPLKEALDRLSRLSGVAIEVQGLKDTDALPVTTEGTDVEVARAVRVVMNECGRPYAISSRGKTIQIVVSAAKPNATPPVKKVGE